jgi:hypothetical protein
MTFFAQYKTGLLSAAAGVAALPLLCCFVLAILIGVVVLIARHGRPYRKSDGSTDYGNMISASVYAPNSSDSDQYY